MRHNKTVKTLDRTSGARRALYRTLMVSVIRDKKIVTTVAKAKAVKPQIERLISRARKGDVATKRYLLECLSNATAANTLLKEIAPKYAQRNGGYTRIIKLANRQGDGAALAQLELVD